MAEEEKKPEKVRTYTTPILFALAVIAAFLVGIFLTRWLSSRGEVPEQAAQASPAPAAPEEMVLSQEQIAEIESGGAAVRGEEGAPVTIVEFSEYQCPFCGRYVEETYAQIWDEYGDQIRYIFRDFPLQFHSHAQIMAEAARCAGDQDQYWEMHDLIFATQADWSAKESAEADIAGFVTQLGLNKSQFDSCLDSGEHTQAVEDDQQLGVKVGVQGTPTFFINGQKLVGARPFSSFKQIIDAELAQ
ncbi:thioredoxin domain-containing protein [Candidatus Saccharibacteria bacterium]|nr:thioredoxin domain-containing protein [Candidatus Saccharibacteria bacterium]